MSFHHKELISVGFDAADINLLHKTTNRIKVKVGVMWDGESNPHFTYQNGHDNLLDKQSGDKFYRHFVKWCYNKTRIRGHRLIHDGKYVNLLFDHSSTNINPFVSIPEYDFSGFHASVNPLRNQKYCLGFNSTQTKPLRAFPKKSETPALVRNRQKSTIGNALIF